MSPDSSAHGHLLDPPLPYDMTRRVRAASRDVRLQQFVNNATDLKYRQRIDICRDAFGDKYDDLRMLAGAIKQHTLDHLDHYLEQFIDHAERSGAAVHYAADGDQANGICLNIARRHHCRLCVKSKSMVTEETHLLPALEAAGVETIETDLGEFIVQLDHDAPSHIVTPMIHKGRESVGEAFERELGAAYTDDPEALTRIAREYLREKFRTADLGISGANFLVAETGSLVICTNEGNGGLSVTAPRIHVAFVGIEKLVPRVADLSVLLKLLARSATAQPMTVYTTFITGPRRSDEPDGPEEVHIILVDNGRTELLRQESRELLRCIRCGACLNACPVYRKSGGGHAYGAVYSGPIGAVITPLFKGLANYPDLPHASSLCGSCYHACPVHIDIPKHLVRLRGEMVKQRIGSRWSRFIMRRWARTLRSSWRYSMANRFMRLGLRSLWMLGRGASRDPYSNRRWLRRGPAGLRMWTIDRDFPAPPSRSFRDWWKTREQEDRP